MPCCLRASVVVLTAPAFMSARLFASSTPPWMPRPEPGSTPMAPIVRTFESRAASACVCTVAAAAPVARSISACESQLFASATTRSCSGRVTVRYRSRSSAENAAFCVPCASCWASSRS